MWSSDRSRSITSSPTRVLCTSDLPIFRSSSSTSSTSLSTAPAGSGRLAQAMRTPAFWLISLGHASALLIVTAVNVHIVAFMTEDLGYSLGFASLVLTVLIGVALFALLGKDPVKGLQVFFVEPLKSAYAISELSVKAVPLILIGLGLAVAKQAADAHGGSIAWARKEGRTVFTIQLPRG